jgi:protease I
MSAVDSIANKHIAVLAADGFEQAELEIPVKALGAAGATTSVVALRPGRIRGMNVHQPGDLVRVSTTAGRARAADYDGLLVPGGYVSPDLLRQSAEAREFVRQIHAAGKPIAMLSQAPVLLVSAGLARSRTLTSWPGLRDDMVNAGAIWVNQDVVRDAHYLFGRGPQDLASFVRELLPFFSSEPGMAAAAPRIDSDPPRETPYEVPEQSLRWLSMPSVGAMLSLALLGVGVVAANQSRNRKKKSEPAAEPGPDAGAA